PFSFYKKDNKKFKVLRSENNEIVFTSRKKKASTFGKMFEITIRVHNKDEKLEMLRKIKKWR
ncbi:MAG: dsDNA-binding SOS-regulon protein, partial [Vicingaceae bacterium]